jgi:hypothetical protein
MRNLMIVTMAGAGAWVAIHSTQTWTASLFQIGGVDAHAMGALFFLPALLAGGLAGALLGGLVAPLR